jgi:hypothetical protein
MIRAIVDTVGHLHAKFREYEAIKAAAGLPPEASLRIRMPVRYTVHTGGSSDG